MASMVAQAGPVRARTDRRELLPADGGFDVVDSRVTVTVLG